MARLARERGWHTIVVVTSRYHVRRARMLFRRCTRARLEFVAADAPFWGYALNAPLEWAKIGVQLTLRRGC